MPKKTKPKLTPAPKDAGEPPVPERYEYMFESGPMSIFQSGDRCELWRKFRSKHEPMGVGYRSPSGMWGLFCTRHPVPTLVAASEDLKDAFVDFCNVYDPL